MRECVRKKFSQPGAVVSIVYPRVISMLRKNPEGGEMPMLSRHFLRRRARCSF